MRVALPSESKDPSYGQLYIYGPAEAAERRTQLGACLDKALLVLEPVSVMDCQHRHRSHSRTILLTRPKLRLG